MKIKKLLSMLLIAVLCLGAIPAGAFAKEESLPQEAAAEAQPEEAALADNDGQKLPEGQFLTEDGFQYQINEAGEVTITRYVGDAADLVVPAQIDGKRVSNIAYGSFSNNDKLTSVVIEEGVGAIENSAFYQCANLAKIDLPSTITSIGYGAFERCALTNTDGFKKLTNLKENTTLYLRDNQITDLSGLKGLPLYGLSLDENTGLKDISPLKGMNTLNSLYLSNTDVSEEDLWSLYRFDTMNLSVFDIATQRELGPMPFVYMTDSNALRDQITYTIADPSVASLEKNSVTINKVGETNATATYKGENRTFKIVVKDMDTAPEAGEPIENLPTLEIHNTPNGTVNLNLKENNELWNISSDKPTLVMDNVKNITTSRAANKEKSWLFIQDQDDSLWVQETRVDQTPTLSKKLDNVAKYVGNNAYNINHEYSTWAWAMHKEGGLSHIKPDGTVEAIPSAGTKDIANLYFYSNTQIAGLIVLKEDGTLWTKLDVQKNQPENALELLASNVDALSGENGFVDTDGRFHAISLEWMMDTASYKVVEKALPEDAVTIFKASGGTYSYFYMDKNGAAWAQRSGTPAQTEKVGDMTIAYTPVSCMESYMDPDTGFMMSKFSYYFQDNEKNLWKYDTQSKQAAKIDENVAKTAIASYSATADGAASYLKTDGTYVNGKKQTQGVADVLGNYLLMKDGRVSYRGQVLLNSVASIRTSSDNSDGTNNYALANDCYMTRADGSVWLHSTRDPSVLTKVANYPEMAPVAVTGVSVAPATLELTMGEAAKQLTATIMPADASNKAVKWSSSDEKIAKVDENGMVTAVGAGKATITATTVDGGFTASCTVSVNKPIVHVTGVALDKTAIGPMTIGYYETLTATVSPADADNKAVTWSTDNAAAAAVDQSGRITSVGAGSATITATTADGGFKASCAVTVAAPKPEAVTDPVVTDEPTQPVAVSNTEITITVPAETIASIPELEGAKLAVRSVNNSSSAEDQAVTQKAEQEVKKVIASNADIASADVLEILDFVFVDPETGEEVPFDGTQTNVSVRLTIKVAPAQKDHYDFFQVYALNDDGTLGEKIADHLTADSDNNISADARHFSKYILVGVNEENAPAPGGDPEEGEIPEPGKNEPIGTEVTISQPGSNAGTGIITDTHTSAYLCAGMLILSAAGLMAFRKRRNAK